MNEEIKYWERLVKECNDANITLSLIISALFENYLIDKSYLNKALDSVSITRELHNIMIKRLNKIAPIEVIDVPTFTAGDQ